MAFIFESLILSEKEARRFWSKVDKNGEGGCWNWTAFRTERGYGTFGFRGQVVRAHRLSAAIASTPIPHGQEVCHHCDNPSCVNPAHLFVGSHQANMADCASKGRIVSVIGLMNNELRPKGERHGMAVLTEEKVIIARQLRASGLTLKEIANSIGHDWRTLNDAIRGVTWRHVGIIR